MYRSFKADGACITQPVLRAAVKRPRTFGFLLTPGFTLLGFSNAVETAKPTAFWVGGHRGTRFPRTAERSGRRVGVGVQSAVPAPRQTPPCRLGFGKRGHPEVCRYFARTPRLYAQGDGARTYCARRCHPSTLHYSLGISAVYCRFSVCAPIASSADQRLYLRRR